METAKSLLSYLFSGTPGSEFGFYIPLGILIAMLAIASVAFSLVYGKKKKTDFAFKRLFKNISKRLAIIAVLLLVYILARYENIPYFSMRIWMYLIGLVSLFLLYRYIKIYVKDYPREKENFKHSRPTKKETNRYLPNK